MHFYVIIRLVKIIYCRYIKTYVIFTFVAKTYKHNNITKLLCIRTTNVKKISSIVCNLYIDHIFTIRHAM